MVMTQDALNQVFALLSAGKLVEGWTLEPGDGADVLLDFKRGASWRRVSGQAEWVETVSQES